MIYTPTPEDVERAVCILRAMISGVGGAVYTNVELYAVLYDHHQALAARGVFVMEWQPIETAPRDGTEVLLWINGDDESPRKGRWVEALDDPRRPHRWSVAYGWCEDIPTHWMPLPKEPQP